MDKRYRLYVKNNAAYPIRVYFNDDINHNAVYPDTAITDFKERVHLDITPGELKIVVDAGGKWESIYEVKVPNDTLSMFIFHSDTFAKYSWDTIRSRYMILKRYDLTLDDLERNNYIIVYP